MHEGAFARSLAVHLVQLSVILEDALVNKAARRQTKHYMMRDPITAEPWEPIAFVRQKMLTNSFSHLPVRIDDSWHIISDHCIAAYLWNNNGADGMKQKLKRRLQCAVKDGALELRCATVVPPDADMVCEVMANHKDVIQRGDPILVGAEIEGERR